MVLANRARCNAPLVFRFVAVLIPRFQCPLLLSGNPQLSASPRGGRGPLGRLQCFPGMQVDRGKRPPGGFPTPCAAMELGFCGLRVDEEEPAIVLHSTANELGTWASPASLAQAVRAPSCCSSSETLRRAERSVVCPATRRWHHPWPQ